MQDSLLDVTTFYIDNGFDFMTFFSNEKNYN